MIADLACVGRIGRPRQEGEEIDLCRTCSVAALAVVFAGVATPNALAGPPATTPSVQVEVVQAGGFHWQDAAVGSLAAMGLTCVVGGVALIARRREGESSPAQPPPTT